MQLTVMKKKKLKLMNEYASQAKIPLALRFVQMAYF